MAVIVAVTAAWGGHAACGKKGPPRAPVRVVPARVDGVTVKRLGQDVFIRFTIPSRDASGATPSTVVAVDVYGATVDPARPVTLDDQTLLERGALVAHIEVEPPLVAPGPGETPVAPPPDPRPAQGEVVTVAERLEGVALVPMVPLVRPVEAAAVEVDDRPPVSPPNVLKIAPPIQRTYTVVGRGRRGRVGALSQRITVPLGPAPPAPSAPVVWYDEDRLVVEWVPPDGVRLRPDEPAAGVLTSQPLVPVPEPHTYNVYASADSGQGQPVAIPKPLNEVRLETPAYMESSVEFGVERCFVVRTVEKAGPVEIESEPSPAVCLTPRDDFPPASPRNLTAVAGEAVVNLIWEPNEEADLAGYVVLRGQAGTSGLQLRALTPSPIRETTYRDTDVRSGQVYVYAVVAIDSATPQNVSAESNRIEVTVR